MPSTVLSHDMCLNDQHFEHFIFMRYSLFFFKPVLGSQEYISSMGLDLVGKLFKALKQNGWIMYSLSTSSSCTDDYS